MITTLRLNLVPVTMDLLRADLGGYAALGAALGATVASTWPPDLYGDDAVRWTMERLAATPAGTERFWGYYFVATPAAGATGVTSDVTEPVLVGVGGFKGPPQDGRVELGYSIVSEYQRRGLALEAVSGMLSYAFAHDTIDEVTAQTLPELIASIGVLEKSGFRLIGEGSEAGVVLYAIDRAAWRQGYPTTQLRT